jgi:phosphoribosyl-dephospho-CoA transferase
MTRLRRHQLAYLTAAGWRKVLDHPWRKEAAVQLAFWAERNLPLVVTRQSATCEDGEIALGWPAPLACGRMRMALQVEASCVAWLDEFPRARAVASLLPRGTRTLIQSLVDALGDLGVHPRVYGSYGWQLVTGLDYVHAGSDLDLWLSVGSQDCADEAVKLLQAAGAPRGLRIDGELMFPGGAGVAWREYATWRAGRARGLLVKRLDGVALEQELPMPAWCERAVA